MEPMVVVLVFAAVASGLAIVRVVTDSRQSNRALRPVPIRRDPALERFRRAADTLRRLER